MLHRIRGAFTLIELLVAIVLILALVLVTLPAVARIIESANYSAAVNRVTATLGNARALATQRRQATGVVFLFDARTQTTTLQIMELHFARASLTTRPTEGQEIANAVAFRPALNQPPVELPQGTGVYGLSFDIAPGMQRLDSETFHWYAGEIINETNQTQRIIPWIFPRNDARLFLTAADLDDQGDPDLLRASVRSAVRHADTFCVIFDPNGSLVPTVAIGFGNDLRTAYLEYPNEPAGYRTNGDRDVFDQPALFDPEAMPPSGLESVTPNPETKMRTANQLAVVDLQRLSREVGVREPWRMRSSTSNAPWPPYFDGSTAVLQQDLNTLTLQISNWVDENAVILDFNRYTGAVLKR